MPGVKAILTADDMPGAAVGATLGEGVQAQRAGRARPHQRAAVPGRADSRRRRRRRADRRRRRSKRSTSISSRCPSSSIRSKRCGPAVRTPALRATSGRARRHRRRLPARAAGEQRGGRNAATGAAAGAAAGTATPAAGAARRARRWRSSRGRSARSGSGRGCARCWCRRRRGRGRGRGGRGAAAGAPAPPQIADWKWTAEDFAKADPDQLPMGKATDEWSYGDIDAGFKKAALVLDETFMTQSTSHQPLETRTAMAYWQNGKLLSARLDAEHGADGRPRSRAGPASTPDKVVLISEYTRRRLRQQDPRRHLDGDSGAALEESQRAGDDAHHPRGRALHRPRAPRHARRASRSASQGRPHHRDRHVSRSATTVPYDAQGDGRSAGADDRR